MEFKRISIGCTNYGDVNPDDSDYLHDMTGFEEVTNVDFRDWKLIHALRDICDPMHEYAK